MEKRNAGLLDEIERGKKVVGKIETTNQFGNTSTLLRSIRELTAENETLKK
ncbi:MAG: hypothetical protein V2I33_18125 [Kangiellaceae bacterium]|jgi:hypothetical protein|nr:hypothetical protein [Kangiellaceae bacterium]